MCDSVGLNMAVCGHHVGTDGVPSYCFPTGRLDDWTLRRRSALVCQHCGCYAFMLMRKSDSIDDASYTFSVMDRISEFEALSSRGKEWTELHKLQPWRIVLRKQAFTPWFEGIDNLELIYQQVRTVNCRRRPRRLLTAPWPCFTLLYR